MSSQERLEEQLHFDLCVIRKYSRINYKRQRFPGSSMGEWAPEHPLGSPVIGK